MANKFENNYRERIRIEHAYRFLIRSKLKHKNTYCYDKVIYVSRKVKVEIGCKIHGSFWKLPKAHERGEGCPYCANRHIKNTKLIVAEFRLIHGETYDYSKVDYSKTYIPVEIICRKHGSFFQKPVEHKRGKGCMQCGINKRSESMTATLKAKKSKTNEE